MEQRCSGGSGGDSGDCGGNSGAAQWDSGGVSWAVGTVGIVGQWLGPWRKWGVEPRWEQLRGQWG
eukprot:6575087-Pyramimonas_sp.AAC.1